DRWAAALAATVLALVCALGLKASARLWSALTVIKLVPLVVLAALVLVHPAPTVDVPALTRDSDWLRASLTATFVFQGFEVVPLLAGQARHPARSMPIAILGSLLGATVLYLILQHGAVAALPDLQGEAEPLVATASAHGSPGIARLVRIGTSVSALGIAFGMTTTTPRYLAALAAGTRLAAERRGMPLRALGLTWLLVVGLIFGLGELGELLALSSLAVVLQFAVVALSLVQLARTRAHGLSPRDAWPALPTLLVALALLSAATGREWLIAGALLVAGIGFRVGYGRWRRSRRALPTERPM
ncbi:MAG: APC family permease, partial [Proteobacteria bacterium]